MQQETQIFQYGNGFTDELGQGFNDGSYRILVYRGKIPTYDELIDFLCKDEIKETKND